MSGMMRSPDWRNDSGKAKAGKPGGIWITGFRPSGSCFQREAAPVMPSCRWQRQPATAMTACPPQTGILAWAPASSARPATRRGNHDRTRDLDPPRPEIASICGLPASTVGDYLQRVKAAVLTWPLPKGISDSELVQRLLKPADSTGSSGSAKPLPDWPGLHEQLRRKGVTLRLLWQEYHQAPPRCPSHRAPGIAAPRLLCLAGRLVRPAS